MFPDDPLKTGSDPGASAAWIGAPLRATGLVGPAAPLHRRAFLLPAAPVRARLQITALGVYEAWINGVRVGDAELQPHAEPRLGHCRTRFESRWGRIETFWEVDSATGAVEFRFKVPGGLPTVLHLPGRPDEPLGPGSHRFEAAGPAAS